VESPTEESADSSGEKAVSLYFMLRGISNEFWTTMKDAIEGQAAADGVDVYVELLSSDDDISGQIEKLSTAIASGGYDGVGAAPVSGTNIIECVISANNLGIPFCNIDDRIDADELKAAGGWLTAYAGTDNKAIGDMAANYIMDTIGKDAKGTIVVLEGATGSSAGEARRDGAISVFETYSDINLVSQPANWDKNKAYDVTTNLLQQYTDLKAIYCANDSMALGAVEAVENAGRSDDIIIVGTDGINDALTAIEEGRLNATCKQDPAAIGLACYQMLLDDVLTGNVGSLDSEVQTEYASALLITKND
jgi:D-allose transport system substrate-binding protein